jgi:hypothetical protein
MDSKLPTVLYLTESFPFGLTSGYQLRVAATILALTHRSRVQLLSFHAQPLSKAQATKQVHNFAATLPAQQRRQFLDRLQWSVVVLPQINQPIGQRWPEWLVSWKTQEPFLVWQYRSPEFSQKLAHFMAKLHPDIIHFSHLRLAAYLEPWLAVPRSQRPYLVYEAQNVEWLLVKSLADFLPKLGRWRWWWRREEWLTKNF